MKFKDLTGEKFGRLTVLGFSHMKHRAQWSCRCECGNKKVVASDRLVSGKTKSCGCLSKEVLKAVNTTHGLTAHPLYGVCKNIIARCNNPKHKRYADYGGRGIKACSDWLNVETFFIWAMANGWVKGLTVERINNDGNYCPENCKLATRVEQANNTRGNRMVIYRGELQPLNSLCGGDKGRNIRVRARIKLGWSVDEAIDKA